MSFLDKAKQAAAEHSDKIDAGIDKLGDAVDDKTGGKHSDKVDAAQDKASDLLDGLGDTRRP